VPATFVGCGSIGTVKNGTEKNGTEKNGTEKSEIKWCPQLSELHVDGSSTKMKIGDRIASRPLHLRLTHPFVLVSNALFKALTSNSRPSFR